MLHVMSLTSSRVSARQLHTESLEAIRVLLQCKIIIAERDERSMGISYIQLGLGTVLYPRVWDSTSTGRISRADPLITFHIRSCSPLIQYPFFSFVLKSLTQLLSMDRASSVRGKVSPMSFPQPDWPRIDPLLIRESCWARLSPNRVQKREPCRLTSCLLPPARWK